MKKILIILCLLFTGCYQTEFSHPQDNSNEIFRYLEIVITAESEPEFIGESYGFAYNNDGQMILVRYLFQDKAGGEWETINAIKDGAGNVTGFDGKITGDNEFLIYVCKVFDQAYIYEIEHNEIPFDMDLSRLHAREEYQSIELVYGYHIEDDDILLVEKNAELDKAGNIVYGMRRMVKEDDDLKDEYFQWNGDQWIRVNEND